MLRTSLGPRQCLRPDLLPKGRLPEVVDNVVNREERMVCHPRFAPADKSIRLMSNLVWVCLILAVAAYGAVVVRNVTETLMGIASHQPAPRGHRPATQPIDRLVPEGVITQSVFTVHGPASVAWPAHDGEEAITVSLKFV